MSPETTQALETTPRLFTVAQFCERHAWATPGGIRHLVFNKATNGFAPCVKRLGRRVLLDEAAVFSWLETEQ